AAGDHDARRRRHQSLRRHQARRPRQLADGRAGDGRGQFPARAARGALDRAVGEQAGSMSAAASLSEETIRERVGERSFAEGVKYARRGAVSETRRTGTTIKARCQGSQPQPYRVEVTFAGGEIATADCSCPVGDGGYRKHVAAVLLTWRERPAAFVEVAPVETALERRSQAELMALVKQMLRRHPEL